MKKQETIKLPKGVNQEFLDNVQALSRDQLKGAIVDLQIQNQENEAFKETEGYLDAADEYAFAKAKWDEVAGPVKETTTSLRNRTKIVVELLKEKGVA
jgi:hypothetical protein